MHPISHTDVTPELDAFALFDFKHQGSQMKLSNSSTLALAVATTRAQTRAARAAEHTIRHLGGTAFTTAAKSSIANLKQAMEGVYGQMRSMQEMHNIWSFQ